MGFSQQYEFYDLAAVAIGVTALQLGVAAGAVTVGVGTTNLAFQLNEVTMFAKGKKALGAPTGN